MPEQPRAKIRTKTGGTGVGSSPRPIQNGEIAPRPFPCAFADRGILHRTIRGIPALGERLQEAPLAPYKTGEFPPAVFRELAQIGETAQEAPCGSPRTGNGVRELPAPIPLLFEDFSNEFSDDAHCFPLCSAYLHLRKILCGIANWITFTLTDQMSDDSFDYPLTVKVRIPDTWKNPLALQQGKEIPVSAVENNGGKFLLVKAIPDRGQVVLTSR